MSTNETITAVECYKHSRSTKIIVFGGQNSIQIYKYETKKSKNEKTDTVHFELKDELDSFDTNSLEIRHIKFAHTDEVIFSTINKNSQVSVYFPERASKNQEQYVEVEHTHSLPVNSSAFFDNHIITGSTDKTCMIYDFVKKKSHGHFNFSSPVVSVETHAKEKKKFLVAEKSGRIYMLDDSNNKSLICRTEEVKNRLDFPLLDFEWNPNDPTKVGGVSSSNYYVWDIRKSNDCLYKNVAHYSGTTKFKWANQHVFATTDHYDCLKVFIF
eukprot:gene566-8076_t